MKSVRLGDIEVIRVEEMVWDISHTFLFPQLSDADFAPQMDWLAPRFFTGAGLMRLTIQAFVIRTPHHTIIVDTCIGNDKERSIENFNMLQTDFLERLHSGAGVRPDDVDYVFCTHFHVDHVGWNTRLVNGRWEPTFPNARYVFHRPEFEHYMNLPEEEKQPSLFDSVVPIAEAGKADLVDGGHMIGDHIHLEPTPGHTPGSQCFRVGDYLVAGDTLFLQGCGRVDLPGGDSEVMYHTLTQRLAKIQNEIILYPGHNYGGNGSAPMGEVRESNSYLQINSLAEWRMMMG